MMSLTYCKLELLICLHFPIEVTVINRGCVTLMWLAVLSSVISVLWCGLTVKSSRT